MTEKNRPITATQQRNMEILLDQDIRALHEAAGTQLLEEARAQKAKAREDWYAANPKLNAFSKKVERYEKTVNKRLKALREEVESLGGKVRHEPALVNTQALKNPEITALSDAIRKIETAHSHKNNKLWTVLEDLRVARSRQILLATLSEATSILEMPSVEDILKDL